MEMETAGLITVPILFFYWKNEAKRTGDTGQNRPGVVPPNHRTSAYIGLEPIVFLTVREIRVPTYPSELLSNLHVCSLFSTIS